MTDSPEQRRTFPSTHWTQLKQAGHHPDPEQRFQALQQLVQRYYTPLKHHLQYVKALSPEKAEDWLHDFLHSKFLKDSFLAQADHHRGRFRTFLLNSLDRYVISQYRKTAAAKRCPQESVPLHEQRTHPPDQRDPSNHFHAEWAKEVVRQAAERMHEHCTTRGRQDVWTVFKKRQIDPALHGTQPVGYNELVAQLHIETPVQAQNLLVTAKRIYTRCLYSVVREYVNDEQEAETEIRDLRQFLNTSSAG